MRVLILAICLALSCKAVASINPDPGLYDDRIKRVLYSEDQVYELTTHYLVETHIIFENGESILYVGAGDPEAWTTRKAANHFFIKPRKHKADTNLKIITSKRTYNFVIRAKEKSDLDSKGVTFQLKFEYPSINTNELAQHQEASKQPDNILTREVKKNGVSGININDLNFDYSMSGDKSIAPVRVFDDGKFTYFQFKDEVALPVIMAVDASNKPILVNYFPEGPYIKIHRRAAQFILLYDEVKVCIWNDSFNRNLARSTVPVR